MQGHTQGWPGLACRLQGALPRAHLLASTHGHWRMIFVNSAQASAVPRGPALAARQARSEAPYRQTTLSLFPKSPSAFAGTPRPTFGPQLFL